jgi:polar amino acid transport system substrate-binding protein
MNRPSFPPPIQAFLGRLQREPRVVLVASAPALSMPGQAAGGGQVRPVLVTVVPARAGTQRRSRRPGAGRGPSCLVSLALTFLLAFVLAAPSSARTLAEIRARGLLSMCANPDALPHSSDRPDTPGFQIEIGRALAEKLGFPLHIDWIVPRIRASLVDCDLLFDTIADPEVQRGPIKLSHPYQKSGVALGLRPGNQAVHGFNDLTPGRQRVGVMVNSLASVILGRRGLRTVPYSFESDMVEDLAHGEIDGAAVSPATIAYYIHAHPESHLAYFNAYDTEPELRWNLAVGLRRSDDALVDAVNAELDKLIADGTLERIYGRYGVQYRKP